jgi:hypothetical protein
MKYKTIQVRLKTDKPRSYLWKKINTPSKIIKIEGFKKTKIKKISENNYEFYFGKRFGFITFVPEKAVNLTFILEKDSSLAWFEIKGKKNCEIIHGTAIRVDLDPKWYKDNKKRLEEHFLEELKQIAE